MRHPTTHFAIEPFQDGSDPPVAPSRSKLMSRVRQKNTKPETVVRQALHAAGFRYRLHRRDLPGSPDIVLPGRKAVVFVHGCFWHRHPGCKAASTPKTRAEFWARKFDANVERDRRAIDALSEKGWAVHVVWECETRAGTFFEPLLKFLSGAPAAGGAALVLTEDEESRTP